ncbi:hypothetical protein ACU6U9_02140 [Pseudomonas sp. HK3]
MHNPVIAGFKMFISQKPHTLLQVVLFAFFGMFSLHSQANSWAELNEVDIPPLLPVATFQSNQSIELMKYQVSDLYVNLSDVISNVKSRSTAPAIIVVVADTLEVKNNFFMSMKNQTVYIYARKIIGEGSGTFLVDTSTGASGGVAVYADEIETNLLVGARLSGSNIEFTKVSPTSTSDGRFIFASSDVNTLVKTTVSIAGMMDIASDRLTEIFEKTFDVAASVFDQNSTLSRAMLTRNEAALRGVPTFMADNVFLENLYLQTANLKQFVDFSALSPNYVPELDANLYQDTYVAYLNAMEAYRTQYDRFVDRSVDISARKDAANLMQVNLVDAVAAETATMNRSQQQVDHFRNTLDDLRIQFRDQDLLVTTARFKFEAGIAKYKLQQEIALVIGILETMVEGSIAIGSSAASGNPAGVIEYASSIPSTSQDLSSIKEKLASIGDLLQRVQEMANNVDDLSSKVNSSVDAQEIADALASFNLVVPSLDAANDVWELFLNEIRNELQLAIDEGIEGSSEFLATLETLVIYGKSITATEVSLMQELSRLIDLKIAAEVNSRHLDRMNLLIDQIEQDAGAVDELETLFFRSLTALKRPMFVAITKFTAAFEYWSLKESQVRPSLNKTYEQYRLDLALLQEQYNDALSSFQPRPQDFNLTNIVVTEPVLLNDFKDNGEMSFNVDLSHPSFIHFDRVRLNQLRVVLQGSQLPEDISYFIDIESNGEYQDRFEDTEYTFNSEQLFRFFGYEYLNNQTNDYRVIIEGAVADDFKFAYFEPTPFTTWSISLRNADDFNLDMIESIRFEFKGTAIPKI